MDCTLCKVPMRCISTRASQRGRTRRYKCACGHRESTLEVRAESRGTGRAVEIGITDIDRAGALLAVEQMQAALSELTQILKV